MTVGILVRTEHSQTKKRNELHILVTAERGYSERGTVRGTVRGTLVKPMILLGLRDHRHQP